MNFSDIIKNFSQQKILVVGDFMLDEYIFGKVERISPEAPVPIIHQNQHKVFPGGAGNVVSNLHALEAQVYLTGALGQDEGAKYLENYFYKMNLSKKQIGLCRVPNRPTTRKTRIIAERQQVCRIDQEIKNPFDLEELREIRKYIKDNISDMSALIFSDYDKGLITPQFIQETVALAKASNCLVAVDPQVTHFDYYKGVDLLTPNHHEAGGYLKKELVDEKVISESGPEILKKLEARLLLLTRGPKGMSLFEKDKKEVKHFPTQAREVFDVTGAGDTVISIFTLALISGASLEKASLLANAGAGLVVGKLGAGTVKKEELLQVIYSLGIK